MGREADGENIWGGEVAEDVGLDFVREGEETVAQALVTEI